MNEAMLAIFKDEIERTNLRMLAEMVEDGDVTIEKAAKKMNRTVTEFKAAVENLKETA